MFEVELAVYNIITRKKKKMRMKKRRGRRRLRECTWRIVRLRLIMSEGEDRNVFSLIEPAFVQY